MPRWFITIPPEGAARSAGLHLHEAFCDIYGNDSVKAFDAATYLQAFFSLLKSPSDDMATDLLNQSLVVQCLDFNATRLVVPALCPVTLFTLNLLRRQGVKTLHWFFEDFRRAVYWRNIVNGYDIFIAIQRGEIERLCETSGARFAFLPAGVSARFARHLTCAARCVDAAFVGLPSPYRIRMLESLHKSGISLVIGGSGWAQYRGPLQECVAYGGWVDASGNAALLQRARIGLNLSIDDPDNDRLNAQVSPRVFEAMAMQCVLLTEDTPLAAEALRGYRYHVFRDEKSLIEATERILVGYAAETAAIAVNRDRVFACDTYHQRARSMAKLADAADGVAA